MYINRSLTKQVFLRNKIKLRGGPDRSDRYPIPNLNFPFIKIATIASKDEIWVFMVDNDTKQLRMFGKKGESVAGNDQDPRMKNSKMRSRSQLSVETVPVQHPARMRQADAD